MAGEGASLVLRRRNEHPARSQAVDIDPTAHVDASPLVPTRAVDCLRVVQDRPWTGLDDKVLARPCDFARADDPAPPRQGATARRQAHDAEVAAAADDLRRLQAAGSALDREPATQLRAPCSGIGASGSPARIRTVCAGAAASCALAPRCRNRRPGRPRATGEPAASPHTSYAWRWTKGPLQVAAERLLALDRFEQRLEVAFAEAARAVALDHLEEEVGRSCAVFVKICSRYPSSSRSTRMPQAPQVRLVLVDLAHAREHVLVVRLGRARKIHAALAHRLDGRDDVLEASAMCCTPGPP